MRVTFAHKLLPSGCHKRFKSVDRGRGFIGASFLLSCFAHSSSHFMSASLSASCWRFEIRASISIKLRRMSVSETIFVKESATSSDSYRARESICTFHPSCFEPVKTNATCSGFRGDHSKSFSVGLLMVAETSLAEPRISVISFVRNTFHSPSFTKATNSSFALNFATGHAVRSKPARIFSFFDFFKSQTDTSLSVFTIR
mmetsp:Transcript_48908/g.56348  ORF Transcript_48908/g.56348 Transcript_48908/m.56348 type:complete len:200 (+) Transcript_48908:1123-1722(+)